MPRALLALLLCLFAANVMANPASAGNDDACPAPKAAKTMAPAGNNNDADADPQHSGSATPTTRVPSGRVGTPRIASPRWHSMLPGMFR